MRPDLGTPTPRISDPERAHLAPRSGSLAVFFRSLAVLTSTGVRLEHALRLLGEGGDDAAMRAVSQGMALAVRVGSTVSAGMMLYPRAFTQMQMKLVQVGEKTGNLDRVLERLGDYEEKRVALEMKVRSALTYPAFLFVLCLLVLVFVPPYLFGGLFRLIEESGVEPPLLTVLLMKFSDLTRTLWFWPALALVLAGLGFGGYLLWERPSSRRAMFALALRVPGLGRATRMVAVNRFARALAFQLEVGIGPLQALDLAGEASAHPILEEQVPLVTQALMAGLPFDEALARSDFVPRALVQMVRVGEDSGRLPAMLAHGADLYEAELEHALEVLTSMMEPVMMLVMGAIVGIIIVATLLPMMQVIQSL